MEPREVQRAVEAARSAASAWGLRVDDAVVVHNSNRIAVRLTPCDVLARVAPLAYQSADDDLEVVVARRLAETGSPVAELEPRVEPGVHVRDGFAVTLWTYYEPAGTLDHRAGRVCERNGPAACRPTPDRGEGTAFHRPGHRCAERARRPSAKPRASRRRPRTSHEHTESTEHGDQRTAAPASSCCTVSRTWATCSGPGTGCSSSISRRAVVGRSSSTSPMAFARPKTGAC